MRAELKARRAQGQHWLDQGVFGEAVRAFENACELAVKGELFSDCALLALSLEQAQDLRELSDQAQPLLSQLDQTSFHIARDAEQQLGQIDQLLIDLPPLRASARLREQLEHARNGIELKLSTPGRVARANELLSVADPRGARRIIVGPPPLDNEEQATRKLQMRVGELEKQIDSHLDKAYELLQQYEWAKAWRQSVDLSVSPKGFLFRDRIQHAAGPLVVRAALAVAEECLATNDMHGAHAQLAEAETVLAVMEQARGSQVALPKQHARLRLHCRDLATLVERIEAAPQQPVDEEQIEDYLVALDHLTAASDDLDAAARDGRGYPHLKAVLEHRQRALTSARAQANEQAQILREAEQAWAERRLDQAEILMAQLEIMQTGKLQLRAATLRTTLASTRTRFTSLLDQARNSSATLDESIAAYSEALELWPNYRQAREELDAALLSRAEQLFAQGQISAAINIFLAILARDPSHPRARAGLDQPDIVQRLAVEFDRLDQQLDILYTDEQGHAESIVAERDKLERAQAGLHDQGLRERATLLSERATRLASQRSAYDTLAEQASTARRNGDWETALRLSNEAVLRLALPEQAHPQWLRERLTAWNEVVEEQRRLVTTLAAQVEPLLQRYLELDDVAVANALVAELNQIKRHIAAAASHAVAAGGRLDPRLSTLDAQIADVLALAEGVVRILSTMNADEGLARLASQVEQRMRTPPPDWMRAALTNEQGEALDPVLARLHVRFATVRQREAADLASRLATALQTGTVEQADALLVRLQTVAPTHAASVDYPALISQRRTIETRLRDLDAQAATRSESLTGVRDDLRAALDLLQSGGEVVDPLVRTTLARLTQLVASENLLGAQAAATEAEATAQLNCLNSSPHWSAQAAVLRAERWFRVASEVNVRGQIATLALLDQIIDAYDLASNYLQNHPGDTSARELILKTRENLQQGMSRAAAKASGRATELLNQGKPALAAQTLGDLFANYYDRLAKDPRYRMLLKTEGGELEQQRDELTLLRDRAIWLTQLEQEVRSGIEQVRSEQAKGQLAAAANTLRRLPDDLGGLAIQTELESLKKLVKEAAKQQFTSRYSALQAEVDLATEQVELERLRKVVEELDSDQAHRLILDDALDVGGQSQPVRLHRDALLKAIRERLLTLRSIADLQAAAHTAIMRADLAGATQLLTALILLLRGKDADGTGRTPVQLALLSTIELWQAAVISLAQAWNQRTTVLEEVSDLVQTAQYGQAEQKLVPLIGRDSRFRQLSAALRPYNATPDELEMLDHAQQAMADRSNGLLRVAHAGRQLTLARTRWNEGRHLREGYEAVEGLSQTMPNEGTFAALQAELRQYEQRLKAKLEQIEAHLAVARTNMDTDLAVARTAAELAYAEDPEHSATVVLLKTITSRLNLHERDTQVAALISQARADRDAGNLQSASLLLNQAEKLVPGHPEVIALQKDFSQSEDASRLLREALEAVYRLNFGVAEAKLKEAVQRNPNPAQLGDVESRRDAMLTGYKATYLYPIQELITRERWSEALERIKDEQQRGLDSKELNELLVELHGQILTRWPAKVLETTQAQLQMAQTEADLSAIIKQLDDLLGTLGAFARRHEAERRRDQARIGLLSNSLDLIRLAIRYRFEPSSANVPLGSIDLRTRRRLELAPQTLAEAEELTRTTSAQAKQRNLSTLCDQADEVLHRLEELGKTNMRDQQQRNNDRHLQQGRKLIADAEQAMATPKIAKDLLLEAQREIAQAQGAPEAPALERDLADDLARFDATYAVFRQCIEYLALDDFNQALASLPLDVTQISRFLREQDKQLRQALKLLMAADSDPTRSPNAVVQHDREQEIALCERALNYADEALASLRSFAKSFALGAQNEAAYAELNRYLDSFHNRFMAVQIKRYSEAFLTALDAKLYEPQVDLETLTAQLDAADKRGWIAPEHQNRHFRCRKQIESRHYLRTVQHELAKPDSNFAQAGHALTEACKAVSDDAAWTAYIDRWRDLRIVRELLARGDFQTMRVEIDALGTNAPDPTLYAQLCTELELREATQNAEQNPDLMTTLTALAELVKQQVTPVPYLDVAIKRGLLRAEEEAAKLFAQGKYREVMALCALGSALGQSVRLTKLHRDADLREQERIVALQGQLEVALNLWNLDQIDLLLGSAETAAYFEVLSYQTTTRLNQIRSQAETVRRQMAEGWQCLAQVRNRDRANDSKTWHEEAQRPYVEAAEVFARARTSASTFREPERWELFARTMAEGISRDQERQNQRPNADSDTRNAHEAASFTQMRLIFQRAGDTLRFQDGEALSDLFKGGRQTLGGTRSRAISTADRIVSQIKQLDDVRQQFKQATTSLAKAELSRQRNELFAALKDLLLNYPVAADPSNVR